MGIELYLFLFFQLEKTHVTLEEAEIQSKSLQESRDKLEDELNDLSEEIHVLQLEKKTTLLQV